LKKLIALFKEEDGVTALEYTILGAAVALVIFGAAQTVDFNTTWTKLKDAVAYTPPTG
jgi:Flp pilus assembly pilin Flp